MSTERIEHILIKYFKHVLNEEKELADTKEYAALKRYSDKLQMAIANPEFRQLLVSHYEVSKSFDNFAVTKKHSKLSKDQAEIEEDESIPKASKIFGKLKKNHEEALAEIEDDGFDFSAYFEKNVEVMNSAIEKLQKKQKKRG